MDGDGFDPHLAGGADHPQRDFLKLVSLGERRAIALWRGLALGGAGGSALLWRLKDRIDRGFIARGRC